jgi:hypothetical protein
MPPNIYLKQKKAGGMKISFQSPPKNLDEKMIYNILRDYKILNAEVLVRDENATVDEFVSLFDVRREASRLTSLDSSTSS